MRIRKRTEQIFVTATPEEKARFEQAAEDAGLAVSTWLRMIGLLAASRSEKAMGAGE